MLNTDILISLPIHHQQLKVNEKITKKKKHNMIPTNIASTRMLFVVAD